MTALPNDIQRGTATLVCSSASPPLTLEVQLVHVGDAAVWLRPIGGDVSIAPGAEVILDGGWSSRLVGRLGVVDEQGLRIDVRRTVTSDRRVFPRVMGGLKIRYRPVSSEDEVERWLSGLNGFDVAGWSSPDPFMSFSGSGLCFEDELHCSEGDLLLLELGPPDGRFCWRCTATVIRQTPILDSEHAADSYEVPCSHHVAIHFLVIPDDAVECLVERTQTIQSAYMVANMG